MGKAGASLSPRAPSPLPPRLIAMTSAPGWGRLALFFAAVYAMLAWPVLCAESMTWVTFAVSAALGVALVSLSTIDVRTYRLPDLITLPLIATGPMLAWTFGWQDGPEWRIAAAAAGFLLLYAVAWIYERMRGRAGLGLGDAKLFAAAGAWLSAEGLTTVMLWATGVALLAVLAARLAGRAIGSTTRVPFGPFLAIGFWLVWLYGPLG